MGFSFFGSSSTAFCSSWNAVRMSFASSAALASFNRSAESFGPAWTAFLYSMTASLNFPCTTYASPRFVCLATSSAGGLEQEERKAASNTTTPTRFTRPDIVSSQNCLLTDLYQFPQQNRRDNVKRFQQFPDR